MPMPVRLAHPCTVTSVAVGGEEGDILFTGTEVGELHAWSTKRHVEKRKWQAHKASITSLQWGEEGLLASSSDGSCSVWSASGESVRVYEGNTGSLRCAISTGDAVIAGGSDGLLRYWTGESAIPTTQTAHSGAISVVSLMATEEGQFLFTASYDKTIKQWEYSGSRATLVRVLKGHENHVKALVYSEPFLFSGSRDESVRMWDVKDGRCLSVIKCGSFVNCVTSKGEDVLFGSSDGLARVLLRKALTPLMENSQAKKQKSFDDEVAKIEKHLKSKELRLEKRARAEQEKRRAQKKQRVPEKEEEGEKDPDAEEGDEEAQDYQDEAGGEGEEGQEGHDDDIARDLADQIGEAQDVVTAKKYRLQQVLDKPFEVVVESRKAQLVEILKSSKCTEAISHATMVGDRLAFASDTSVVLMSPSHQLVSI